MIIYCNLYINNKQEEMKRDKRKLHEIKCYNFTVYQFFSTELYINYTKQLKEIIGRTAKFKQHEQVLTN